MLQNVEIRTLLGSIEKWMLSRLSAGYSGNAVSQNKVMPGTAASCSTNRHRQVRPGKMASCFTLLRRITNSKASIQRSFQSVNSLLRQAFPEGFMPP